MEIRVIRDNVLYLEDIPRNHLFIHNDVISTLYIKLAGGSYRAFISEGQVCDPIKTPTYRKLIGKITLIEIARIDIKILNSEIIKDDLEVNIQKRANN